MLLFGALLLSTGCNDNQNSVSIEQVRQFTSPQASQLKDIVVVDVRTSTEYEAGHIPGSISIPVDSLEQNAHILKGQKLVIVYCQSGCKKSLKAYHILKQRGFKAVKNLSGGIDAWKKAGGNIEGNQTEDIPGTMSCPVKWELGKGCEN